MPILIGSKEYFVYVYPHISNILDNVKVIMDENPLKLKYKGSS